MEYSKAEKMLTVVDKPSSDCKSNPCLNGKPVTSENIVEGANVGEEYGTNKTAVHGCTHIGYLEQNGF